MADPFRIDGPAVVSFSGGRTSGLLLRRVLDAGLQPDVHVLFANTGKEREETLAFVDECARRWRAPIVWLERHDLTRLLARRATEAAHAGFAAVARDLHRRAARRVGFETASRLGEPFDALIAESRFLPNPVTRFCTTELKIRVMKRYMLARGYEHWTNVVGLRADEPGRVARQRAGAGSERWDVAHPLFEAGVRLADVMAFWRAQPFDLQLRPWEGNCDLCFLKGRAKRERIMRDRPDTAPWWIGKEVSTGAKFRADAPPYEVLYQLSRRPMLPFDAADLDGLDDLGDCVCNEAA